MAIVSMKRLGLIALRSDQEKLIRQLQQAGCVEISRPQDDEDDPTQALLSRPPGDDLAAAKERLSRGELALSLLKQYGEKQKGLQPRPTVSADRFFDEAHYAGAQAMVDRLWEINRELSSLASEKSKLASQRASLTSWLELDVPLETTSSPGMIASFGTLPATANTEALMGQLAALTDLWDILPAGRDSGFQYLFFACHRSVEEETAEILQQFGFSRTSFRGLTGTAAENDARLAHEIEANEERTATLQAEVHGMSPSVGDIKLYVDFVSQEVGREEGKTRLMDTDQTFYLTGWFPAEEEGKVESLLSGYVCAWETETPTEEEYPQVPVKLKNNWFTKPMSMVTEMYSLPAYGSLDPNPLMAPFFVLFYGMMMADMGYGLLMLGVGFFLTRKLKAKGTMGHMGGLLILCGVSTFLFGLVTGGFFGDFIPQLVSLLSPNSTFEMPSLFTPVNDTLPVLVGALALGVVQIITGMAVSVWKKLRAHKVLDALFEEITWWIILGGLVLAILGITPLALMAGGVLLVVGCVYNAVQAGGGPVKIVLISLKNLGGSLYNNVTGYFQDILSYSRLMALMLAGAVVAQVFNTLGAILGGLPFVGIILFVVVSMAGNALNFALNLLGCYVHDMRLQCLEYFNRFYEDGGQPFRPLNIDTKNVDIV